MGFKFQEAFLVRNSTVSSKLFRLVCVGFAGAMAAVPLSAQTISTLAGGGPNNLAATTATLASPWAAVRDANGNTYISDTASNRIFKVDGTGELTVFAGNIVNDFLGDGGPATLASLSAPSGIALDSSGNLYIADAGNDSIREVVASTGIIQTVAGNGRTCSSNCGDGGPATSAQLNSPAGVWLDGNNNIYIADTSDYVIRVVNTQATAITIAGTTIQPGDIETVAGMFQQFGSMGDGGPANAAMLNDPQGVFVDSAGNIYIADTTNSAIRVVNPQASGSVTIANVAIPAGDIQTVAGTITSNCTTAPVCNDGGPAIQALLYNPQGVTADAAGNLYIADTVDQVIRKVNGTNGANPGIINTIVGNYNACISLVQKCGDGGLASSSAVQLAAPSAVFVDSAGDLFIGDQNDNAIRAVNEGANSATFNGVTIPAGDIDTIAGVLFNGQYFGDGGPALEAALLRPQGVASDPAGNILIADTDNSVIRKVTSDGKIAAYAGTGGMPCDLAPCGDGQLAAAALFFLPQDVYYDPAGNLFISDYHGVEGTLFPMGVSIVREVLASTGKIQAVAGSWSAGMGYSGDGGSPTAAQLNTPTSVAVDSSGDIFIADSANNVIREVVASTGKIQTVAGNFASGAGYGGDNGPANMAQLNNPTGVAVDQAGNLYIADTTNDIIRVVNRQSIATTIAGVLVQPGNIATIAGVPQTPCHTLLHCGDGGSPLTANLDNPSHVLVDFAGDIFIADTGDYAIREVSPDGISISSVADVSQNPGFAGDGKMATDPSVLLSAPQGLTSDPFGNLFFADNVSWRVREIAKLVDTAPTASLSAGTLTFPGQGIGTISSTTQMVTLTNSGNRTPLQITSIAIGGANGADFSIATNTCPSPGALAAGDNCGVGVSFKPSAFGPRSGTLVFTDSAGVQNVALAGTGENASTVTLSSSSLNDTSFVGEAVTLTSAVTGSGGTPTGTVTFSDGATALGGPVAINGSGIAILSTSSLSAGNHSLTAFYSGDSNFAQSTSSVLTQVVNSPNFILPSAISLSAGTVAAGKQLTATITIAAGGSFTGSVAVACAITPASANAPTCALNPTSVTPTEGTPGTSTLTISTVAPSSSQANTSRSMFYSMWLIFPAMIFSVAGTSRNHRRKLLGWMAMAMVCLSLLLLGGCGGSSSGSGGGGGTGGTTAGNYTVTVTATSGALMSQTSTATFTVQ